MLDLLRPGFSYGSYWTNSSDTTIATFPERLEHLYTTWVTAKTMRSLSVARCPPRSCM
jgi:hypothetical protein